MSKYMRDSTGTSVLYIEADLPESYPGEAIPEFSLSNINNSHLSSQTKEVILHGLLNQVSRPTPSVDVMLGHAARTLSLAAFREGVVASQLTQV